jgi:serine protease Do
MTFWKTTALTGALLTAAAAGATFAPPAQGQTRVFDTHPSAVTTIHAEPQRAFELFTGGSRIGVTLRDVAQDDVQSAKLPGMMGAIVEEVAADSPAEKAGIRKNDVIVEFDGERVRSVRQLTRLVQETPAGRQVQVAVLRDGQRSTMPVEPRAGDRFTFERLHDLEGLADDFRYDIAPVPPRPPSPPRAPRPPEVWRFDDLLGSRNGRLGISIDTLSPQLAEYFGTKEGVLVTTVDVDSVAAKAGLKAGDVITSFNGTAVNDLGDLRRQIQSGDSDEFTIGIMRDKNAQTLKGKFDRSQRRRTTRTIL